jgi:pimeloyl-ACP methyl ester carboxylesterase
VERQDQGGPILLFSSRFDPAISYHDAQVAERRLGNAVLLTENGYGHLTLNDPSSCIENGESATS